MKSKLEIIEAARSYHAANFANPAFVPGETYVAASGKSLDADDLAALIEASLDLWLTAGRFADELETRLAEKLSSPVKALLVASGSSANLLAVSSLASTLEPGDEVLTAAAAFPTTVNPIVQQGLVPVFVDVDPRTLNPTLESLKSARSAKTRGVVLAHALGNPFRADEVGAWCRSEGLFLIEDCCDALGATIGGRSVGAFGDYATLSFYPAHHITTGEGGAVLARDARLRRGAESLRDWGRDCWCPPGHDNTCAKRFGWTLGDLPPGYDHKYVFTRLGYNLKMTDLQAAIGVSQLSKIDQFVAVRRRNWRALRDGVEASTTLKAALTPVEPTSGPEPSWFGFAVTCDEGVDRQKLVAFLEGRKVGTRLVFAGNLTRQPAYRDVKYRVHGRLEHSDRIMRQTFWVGVHPGIGSPQVAYMLEQLEAGVRAAKI